VSKAAALLMAGGHRRELANVYVNPGYSAVQEGNAQEAIHLLEQAVAAAESVEYPHRFVHPLQPRTGIDDYRIGDWLEADYFGPARAEYGIKHGQRRSGRTKRSRMRRRSMS
jgi:hypothetical protein